MTLGVGLLIGVLVGLLAFGGGGGTTTTTVVRTVPSATGASAPSSASRAGIRLAVLNGAGVSGIAHRTAAQAQRIGYTNVATGDAPRQLGPSTVYFRPRAAPAAARVAKDLGITQARPLPAGGAVATAAPPAAQVIVVLGSG